MSLRIGFEFEVMFPDMETSSNDVMEKWIEYATANWEYERYYEKLEYFIDNNDDWWPSPYVPILDLPKYIVGKGFQPGDDIPEPYEIFTDWRSRNSKMFREVIHKNPFVKNLPWPAVLSYKESRKSIDVNIIKPDLSLGPHGLEVSTRVMKFREGVPFCKKMLSYIDKYAATTDECGFHVSISDTSVKKMRGLKIYNLLRSIDQKYIYRHFPERKDSDYAKPWSHEHDGAINLEHLVESENPYVEFRFIGGKDYHKKWEPIKNIIENYVESLQKSL